MSILFIDDSGVESSFLGKAEDNSTQTTYSFLGVTLGANYPFFVLAVHWQGQGAAETLSAVTVDGVAASIICQTLNNREGSALVIAAGGGHATGDVSVVITGTGSVRGAIAVFGLTGPGTVSSSTTSTASAPTATLNVPAGASVIACAGGFGTGLSVSWAGLTERSDAFYDAAGLLSSASLDFAAANASLGVTATISGSLSNQTGCFAVFGP